MSSGSAQTYLCSLSYSIVSMEIVTFDSFAIIEMNWILCGYRIWKNIVPWISVEIISIKIKSLQCSWIIIWQPEVIINVVTCRYDTHKVTNIKDITLISFPWPAFNVWMEDSTWFQFIATMWSYETFQWRTLLDWSINVGIKLYSPYWPRIELFRGDFSVSATLNF